MGAAWVKPDQSKEGISQRTRQLIHTPPASGGHQLPGGGGRGDQESVSCPVDDAHQARLTQGVGEWAMNLGGDKKEDRLVGWADLGVEVEWKCPF